MISELEEVQDLSLLRKENLIYNNSMPALETKSIVDLD